MSQSILTLFGEEKLPVPEAAPKKKAPPKDEPAPEAPRQAEKLPDEKQYYSIGEVAAIFNVNTSHIRFWTNEFGLNVRTTRKGDRLYTPEQIKELKAIYHLVKERGYTLAGAKAKLKEKSSIDVASVDLRKTLMQLRNKLMSIRNKI